MIALAITPLGYISTSPPHPRYKYVASSDAAYCGRQPTLVLADRDLRTDVVALAGGCQHAPKAGYRHQGLFVDGILVPPQAVVRLRPGSVAGGGPTAHFEKAHKFAHHTGPGSVYF